jgi:hypothetical protein
MVNRNEATMNRLDARLGRLEAQITMRCSKFFIRVIAEDGESSDGCIRRHGHDREDPNKDYIVRCIVDPESRTAQLCGGDHAQD